MNIKMNLIFIMTAMTFTQSQCSILNLLKRKLIQKTSVLPSIFTRKLSSGQVKIEWNSFEGIKNGSTKKNAALGLAAGTAGLIILPVAIYGLTNGHEVAVSTSKIMSIPAGWMTSLIAGGPIGATTYVCTVLTFGCANAARLKWKEKKTKQLLESINTNNVSK